MKKGKQVSVHDLSASEARQVLLKLWNRGGSLREKIREQIERMMKGIDLDAVAGRVQSNLEMLRVEDLWDRSGPTRFGYVDPVEETFVMVEEVLQLYVDEMVRYFKLGWEEEALHYCAGILEGIYLYATESESEFKTWAQDDPGIAFDSVRDKGRQLCKDDDQRERLQRLIEERCPTRP